MSLRKNVLANYLGQGWRAIMSLAFVPLYIKYIGVEAYGLIGIFVMLQAWLGLLDIGMKPTLVREMARFSGGGYDAQSVWDLLRSIEIVALGIATNPEEADEANFVLKGEEICDLNDHPCSACSNPRNEVKGVFRLISCIDCLKSFHLRNNCANPLPNKSQRNGRDVWRCQACNAIRRG